MIKRILRLLWLLANPANTNAVAIYEFVGVHNLLGRRSLYLNLGYWDAGETDYDRACERLAEELGLFAGLAAGKDQLDVGFGFGDQDMYWAERFGLRRIIGLNISPLQVERARQRVAARGLDGRIDLRQGSATAMPLGDASVDTVTSLESAFHYVTRETFFQEAYRVLQPGGVLAVADIIPREGTPDGLVARVQQRLLRALQIPRENLYPITTYREKLRTTGFCDIEVRSIRDRVFVPFAAFVQGRVNDAQFVGRRDSWFAGMLRWTFSSVNFSGAYDYVLVRARKPSSEPIPCTVTSSPNVQQ